MSRKSGQIIKEGERKWRVKWFVGRDEHGKRKYRSQLVHGTKRDASRVRNGILRDRDQGLYVEPSKITLDQYLDHWLRATASSRSRRTNNDYAQTLARYIRPILGPRRLDQVAPLEIQQVYTDLTESGKSSSTVRGVHAILNAALNRAVRWRMLVQNPAKLTERPKVRHKEIRAFSADEMRRFREAAKGTRFEVLFTFMLGTGVRPGEALGIRWQDLDLEEGTACIRQTIAQTTPGRWEEREPKTEKSRRTLTLAAPVVQALKRHRAVQAEIRLQAGAKYQKERDLVFATNLGGMLNQRNVLNRYFKAVLKRAELPNVGMYTFRHTYATHLLADGASVKYVSSKLGHASAQLTLDTYAHVLPDEEAAMADRIEQLLF